MLSLSIMSGMKEEAVTSEVESGNHVGFVDLDFGQDSFSTSLKKGSRLWSLVLLRFFNDSRKRPDEHRSVNQWG